MSQMRPMIRDLGKYTQQLAEQTNQQISQLNQQVQGFQDVIAAIVRTLGEDTIRETVQAIQKERQDAFEAQQEAVVSQLKEQGILVPAEKVGDDSLVIGTDTFDGGNVRKVRFETKPLNDAVAQAADPEAKKGAEQARARFVGLPVGGEVKSDDAKVTFKVVEVYDIDRAKAEEVRTKTAAEAAAAQKAAAEAAPPPATGGMKPVKKAPGGKKNANAAK